MSNSIFIVKSNAKIDCRKLLTGTFFWVTTTAVSVPFKATEVRPPWLIALNAYSVKPFKIVYCKVKQPACFEV